MLLAIAKQMPWPHEMIAVFTPMTRPRESTTHTLPFVSEPAWDPQGSRIAFVLGALRPHEQVLGLGA